MQMAEEYNKTRIDSFLVTTDIKPRDSRLFGHTDKQIEEERQKLLKAAETKDILIF